MKSQSLTRFINLCVILFMLFFALVPAGAVFAQEEIPPDPPAEPEIVELEGGTPGPGPQDVRFCPGTASATDISCVEFADVDAALLYAQGLADGAGTIFVSDGFTDPGGTPLAIDENAFLGGTQNILFGLMGGYNFTSGAVTGQSTFQRPMIISNFNNGGAEYTGGMSLMGFIFNTYINDYTLNVVNSENVEIADVEINASAQDTSGILIANSEDVSLDTVDITLDSSSPMMGRGVFVNSSDDVSLENVSIDSDNWGLDVFESDYFSINGLILNARNRGIDIYDSNYFSLDDMMVNSGNTYALNVNTSQGNNTISNSIFHSDEYDGMLFYGIGGNMLLDHVQSSHNGYYGLEFYNEYGETGSLTISNSDFSENADDNIYIGLYDDTEYGSFGFMPLYQVTGFDITIENTTADGANGEEYADGLSLFQYYDGNIIIRNSSFSQNDDNGLYILSFGNVALENVTANGNLSNSYIQNNMGYYGSAPGGSSFGYAEPIVLVTGSSFSNSVWSTGLDIYAFGDVILEDSVFNNNTYGGLSVYTQSSIYAHCLQANYSSEDETTGARLEAEGLIDISCSEFNNNGGTGLYAWAPAITYRNITATGNAYDQIYWDTENLTEVIGEPCNCSWCGGSSGGTSTGSPALPSLPAQVVLVYTDPGSGSTQLLGDNTTIFKLMEEQPQPPDKELARVTLATGVAPADSLAVLTYKSEADLPATLPEGSQFVGPAYEFTVTDPDGDPMGALLGFMELRFTLPEGGTVPAGMEYAILHFDASSGEWVQLDTYLTRLYAFAYTAQTGIFTLALVPVP